MLPNSHHQVRPCPVEEDILRVNALAQLAIPSHDIAVEVGGGIVRSDWAKLGEEITPIGQRLKTRAFFTPAQFTKNSGESLGQSPSTP